MLVAICSDNRFGFVLWGVKKAQLNKLSSVVLTAIRETMADYGIRQEIIDSYAPADEPMCLMNAAGRKGAAQLNRAIKWVEYTPMDTEPTVLRPFFLAKSMNRDIVMSEPESFHPEERMLERLRWRYHQEPIAQKAFVLEAELDLERYTAKRTLIVPARRTFADLHQILQRAFDWEDYHLHEYVLHDDGEHYLHGAGAYDEELDGTDANLGADEDFCLADLLRDGSQFTYLYDFGDGWEVELRVASAIEDYDKTHPTCTLFEGDVPPEDVGGVYVHISLHQYRQFTPMIPPIHTMIPTVHSWILLTGRHLQPEAPPDSVQNFSDHFTHRELPKIPAYSDRRSRRRWSGGRLCP